VIDTRLAVCDVHDMVIDPISGCAGCRFDALVDDGDEPEDPSPAVDHEDDTRRETGEI